VTTSAADEMTFILSEEILGRIDSFFPPPNDQREKAEQARSALGALINVIGVILCEIECADCWQLTLKAVEGSFAQMLKDAPTLRAEVEAEQKSLSIH
jgi:hypothetical protein